MLILVVYDISENKSRNTLIKLLRHFGFYRIQKSVFAGDLSLNERIDLIEDIEVHLSSKRDSIIIFPICEACKDSIEIFSDYEITLPHQLEFKLI
ncbi:MAG: CRISPR-associated endonuclease Cas2 [Methanobrevibacter sp.]|jgi:CRISPR-associated protein Cas2|nr:CRISPR-associated endonuclease Cas2 [Candidatus Methanovirga basalitermitum]